MKTTGLLAASAKLILGGSLLLSLGLCPSGPAAARQPAQEAGRQPAPDFAHLQKNLAGQPDSSRLEQLRTFGDAMVDAGRPAQARLAYEEALRTAQATTTDATVLSKATGALGYLAATQADYPAALGHYQRAYDLVKHTTAYRQQAFVLLRLGIVYQQAGDSPQAVAYFRRALAVARAYHLPQREGSAYDELAIVADVRHQPDSALYYNQLALNTYRAARAEPEYYSALLNRGIMLKNLGQYAESERAYRAVLRYAEAQPDDYVKLFVYTNLPGTLLLLGRPAEAERYVRLGLAASAHAPERARVRQDLYSTLTRIKEAQHDYRAALRYQRLATAHQDTLLNADKTRQLLEVKTRYQTAEQQARIGQLAAQSAQRLRQLGALGLGSAGLLGFLVLTGWQYRLIRRKNAQLEATNQVVVDGSQRLAEQSRRLTLLIRELHHRVKNNLAIISSLLRLQSNRLLDEGAARAVREGQQRVEAMSLIHQRLYQTEEVTTVDMRLYVTDLAHSLLTAYGYTSNTLDLRIDIAQPKLDVDVAVPLGLILNELLTNSFKYAFAGHPRPALTIRLAGGTTAPPTDLELEVQDNGPGIDLVQWKRPGGSFGKRLIASLSEQVGGRMEIRSEAGTHYRLRIPAQALLPTA